MTYGVPSSLALENFPPSCNGAVDPDFVAETLNMMSVDQPRLSSPGSAVHEDELAAPGAERFATEDSFTAGFPGGDPLRHRRSRQTRRPTFREREVRRALIRTRSHLSFPFARARGEAWNEAAPKFRGGRSRTWRTISTRCTIGSSSRIEEDEKSKGGIIIPDTAKEEPQQGKVVAVGPEDATTASWCMSVKASGRRVVREVPGHGHQDRR